MIDGIEKIQYITEDCIPIDDHSKHGAFKYPDNTNKSILLPKGDVVSINNENENNENIDSRMAIFNTLNTIGNKI